jgi:hypothetical protein
MPDPPPVSRKDEETVKRRNFLAATGMTVVSGRESDVALAGHLHWARVETFFVHAYVLPLSSP